jgi:hypothetical protein
MSIQPNSISMMRAIRGGPAASPLVLIDAEFFAFAIEHKSLTRDKANL